MIRFDEHLPSLPKRVLVAGVSGCGKTTLARRVSDVLGIPHTEIDALFHGANWSRRDEFEDDLRELALADAWVTEWQYREARPVLAARADLLVWLDLPFASVTLPRVVTRTVRRRMSKEVLWNGNREAPLHTFFTNREHIIRWAWSTRNKLKTLVPEAESGFSQLAVVRLRSQREVDSWLKALDEQYGSPTMR